ncbi:SusC/RagA family TonB-linked outer membrane protein [Zobellia russellii]|uniref:SusC/RagA family TonB-linked outer membrane protein n=1 Tax=Zobellia russellii TaxID=248907 RepID=UPI001BFEF3AE|nr:SusC/RagA family TonB-linked outer membrane protein [Zobellia russellii]MBT9190419.1 SusC/RagA family TonB-linked outer membrane protein [Zobellia russellii]
MKQQLLLSVIFFCICSTVSAQEISISGHITDEDGQPLPGVDIIIKNSTIGVISDFDGNYQIKSPNDGTLIFSSLGFATLEISVNNQLTIDVSLETSAENLSEVVVTALGFKEDADQMGATSSKVGGESIARTGEAQLINGMSGRAAGVSITRSSGDPGAGSFIQIRGANTITGSSQPLVIVDGIPISNNSQDDSPNADGNTSGGVVQQSRMNDINPNDIASVQILKGASAAALWGSRAANGVIMITTKKGSFGEKMKVSFRSSYSVDQINIFHPKQNKYGQGSNGVYSPTSSQSWGDKISNRSGAADVLDTSGEYFEGNITGNRYYPILEKNQQDFLDDSNYDQIFSNGFTMDNSVSLSGGNESSTFYFSVGHLNQDGIYKANSNYKRSTIRFNTEKRFNDMVKMTTNATYISSNSDRVQRGNNTSGTILAYLRNPPDFDITDYIGSYYSEPNAAPIENRQRSYRRYLGNTATPIYNNPLWPLYQQENTSNVNRIIMSSELKIMPFNWFDLTARVGIDNYTDQRDSFFPANEVQGAGNGYFKEQVTQERELNLDVIGRFSKEISKDFSSTLLLGFNINDRKYSYLGADITGFLVTTNPPYSFDNAATENKSPFNYRSTIRTSRAYATLNLEAYESIFLNLSLAGESSSTFGEETKNTFYYPAADIAWQFSNLGALQNSEILSFGKLRASFGTVGVQPQPYRTATDFVATSFSNSPWGDVLDGAQYGDGAFIQSPEQGDALLKPERKTEFEVGTDLRFFNNKLKTSFTYYYNQVNDLLVPITLAPSIGFVSKYTNAAKLENRGIELDLSFDVVSNKDLQISPFLNFNRNRNEVLDLAGTESVYLAGIPNFVSSQAVEGHPVGVLWGGKYARDDNGSIVLDENGFPTIDPSSGVIGDPNPDWRGGAGINASYKNLSLNILFETSQGNDLYSGTRGVMYNFGTHEDNGNEVTLTQDLVNYSGDIIAAGSTVRGNIEDFGAGPVLLDQSYYTTLGSGFSALKEQHVYDASWTRLREVTLGYSLNSEAFRKSTKLQSVTFSVTGRNLWLLTDVVGVDPETNLTGASNGRGMDYFNSPGTQSFIFSLSINF